jgi:hypothetical protein
MSGVPFLRSAAILAVFAACIGLFAVGGAARDLAYVVVLFTAYRASFRGEPQ